MKKFKKFLIVLLVIFVVLTVAVMIFIKTADVNKYKYLIEDRVTEALHKESTIGDLSFTFSWLEGIGITINDLNIYDDKARGKTFLTAKHMELGIDVMTFITKRVIAVDQILIQSPNIYYEKQKNGTTNIDEILSKDSKSTQSAASKEGGKKAPDVTIALITLEDGTVEYYEESAFSDEKLTVDKIDLKVKQFSFGKPFGFDAQLSFLHPQQNINATGKVLLNQKDGTINVNDFTTNVDLNNMELDKLIALLPPNEELKKIQKVEGKIDVHSKELSISSDALSKLSLNGQFKNGAIIFKGYKPFSNIGAQFEIDEKDAHLKELTANYGSGNITLETKIDNYLLDPAESFYFDVNELRAEDLLASYDLPVEVEGAINGSLEGSLKGHSIEAIENTLNSRGKFEMTEGLLKDINVLRLVLEKISFIPNLVEQIYEKLPESYKEKLKEEDTVINLVSADIHFNNGLLHFTDGQVDADGFILNFSGNLNLAKDLILKSSFTIPLELSQLMVASVEDLSVLVDDSNRIHFPLKPYNGPVNKLVIYPDIGDIAERVIKNRGKQELQKVIFDAIGIEESSPPSDTENTEEAPPQQPKSPEQEAVESILNAIFQ